MRVYKVKRTGDQKTEVTVSIGRFSKYFPEGKASWDSVPEIIALRLKDSLKKEFTVTIEKDSKGELKDVSVEKILLKQAKEG